MNKLSNCNVGLDDSSSLYMGHAILNLLAIDFDEGVLFHCMQRVQKSSSTTCIRSYSLPLCFVFSSQQKDMLPQLLMLLTQSEGKSALLSFLESLVKNFRHNLETSYGENDLAVKVQALGLAGLLQYTTQDIEMAGLPIGKEKLQNCLVNDLT
jgi:hypothetical protein